MLTKTIFFLLFLAQLSVSEHHNQNISIDTTMKLQKSATSYVLVNPTQVQHLERTLGRFLSKVAEPVKGPIVLKSASSDGNDLQSSIREICESIRKKVMQFAKDCNLRTTFRHYEKNSSHIPRSEDWLSEILLQGSYTIHDLANMANEITGEIQVYFGKPNASVQYLTTQANDFQFLGVIYDATDFGERLSQCLVQMQSRKTSKASFDINRAFFNMVKNPPNAVVKLFRSNMDSTIDNYSKTHGGYRSWQTFLCYSIVQEQGIPYNDCVRDLQHLEKCLRSMRQGTRSKVNDPEMKPWVKAIQRLSDCTIQEDKQGKVQIFCKSSLGMPKDIKQKIKYMFERTLNRKLSKKSPLNRAADDLGDTLAQTKWGQMFIDELCQYFAIYEDGTKKLRRLSALARKDKRAIRKYKEVAKALDVYKKGIILRTFGTVGKMHRSSVEFEKYLVNGIKLVLNETWQSHVRILSSMMDWMTKLLELHVGVGKSEKEQPTPNTEAASAEWNQNELSDYQDDFESDSEQTGIARSKNDIMKKADTAMNNLMESMNHVSRQRSLNDKSMLSCLANNLLLVTMFMETMGFVSTLFCFGRPTIDPQNSSNFNQESNRLRRSLYPLIYKEDIDTIPESYFLLKIYDNLTVLAVDENY